MRNDQEFWKRKLMAFLHDLPCECFDIAKHEARAKSFRNSAGISDEDYEKFSAICGWTASAADRFPFPGENSGWGSKLEGGEKSLFRHPLGGAEISFEVPMQTADLAEEKFQSALGVVPADQNWDWKSKFYLYWRWWPEKAAKSDERLAYLPADTRMPDYTIWTHMSMTSALQSCVIEDEKGVKIDASFLIFNLGPVQDFIAQARSTRDLVSGSYMLSWLIAHAIKEIADEVGPDNIIYPSMRGQVIFDALNRGMFESIKLKDKTLWERIGYNEHQLATPSLPNRFFAVVPTEKSKELAERAENAIRNELKQISNNCWLAFEKLANQYGKPSKDVGAWKKRWDKQVELFPQITWTVTPWDEHVSFDVNLLKIKELTTKEINQQHIDSRFYTNNEKNELTNIDFTWSTQYALAARENAARKNTRDFKQYFTDENQFGTPKDSLSGKEEIIGSEDLWNWLLAENNPTSPFKENESAYGAMNIIKRLWLDDRFVPYLKNKIGKMPNFAFKSVPEIAKNNDDPHPYIAVIAIDGDEMGKWISGEKTPKLYEQLSEEAQNYLNKELSNFDRSLKRPLSPSYHLQFSEALANFANHIAWRVVKDFKGELIYAGGDDVLAILPADKAIPCALTLRSFFRGESPETAKESKRLAAYFQGKHLKGIDVSQKGWVKLGSGKEFYPLLVPGSNADLSCGIAIGHEKYPLQALVREARNAEKRAKNEYDRSAFAISLLKHGGEIIHWGMKWPKWKDKNESEQYCPAIELYEKYCEFRGNFKKGGKSEGKSAPDSISGRFPYVLAERLKLYELGHLNEKGEEKFEKGFNPKEVILKELEEIFDRQGGKDLRDLCEKYLESLETGYSTGPKEKKSRFRDFPNLFLAAAFIEREIGGRQ